MPKQKILQILLMATKGGVSGMSTQHELGGQEWEINVKAKDIIDIIDRYKGGGYGVLTERELGGQEWGN